MDNENDCVTKSFVAFLAAWAAGGLIGIIPWNYVDGSSDWHWHMDAHGAWLIWAVCVTLFAIFVAACVYASARWD